MGEYSVQEAKVVTTIPSLNEERSIERSVRSLMTQDLPASWHMIHVVDGGSTDKTIDIVKELQDEVKREGGPRIQVIRNPERFSPQARNLSLEACPKDTEFIFEMSSHAWVPKDHLRKRIEDLRDIEESEGIRVGSVGCRIVDADDEVPLIGQWIEHACQILLEQEEDNSRASLVDTLRWFLHSAYTEKMHLRQSGDGILSSAPLKIQTSIYVSIGQGGQRGALMSAMCTK